MRFCTSSRRPVARGGVTRGRLALLLAALVAGLAVTPGGGALAAFLEQGGQTVLEAARPGRNVTAAAAASSGAWEVRAPSGPARQEVSYVQANGKLYLAGGSTAHEVYDPAANAWTPIASLPANLDHIQAVEVGGLVYYVGGLTAWPGPHVNTVYVYNPATDAFTQGTPMPSGRGRGAGGVAVYNGKIYVAGGLSNGVAVPWLDVYDPVARTWAQLADMPRARDHFQAAVVAGKLYAIGGRNKDIDATTTANDVYDFSTGAWSTGLAPLPTARGGFAAAALGSEILVIGGEGGGGTFATVEAYDTTANTWRTLAPMPTARHGIQAAVCNGGVYVAAGGTLQGGGGATDAHEVFFLNGPTPCPAAADTTPPTVSSTAPAAGATGVAATANASAVFSEAMSAATLTS
nr:Ig-like domain-containing protein [Actinomycetota bacterium]